MATFEVIPLQEARRLVMAPRRLAETEYREYVAALDANTAGRIELGEGDRPISVRARLKAAAKAEGKSLEIQRQGDTLVFWLSDASSGR
ncbi:MAG TPA: hypothetical protein VK066_08190 [Chloroflexota bacterium]|nr:hypothetical protein [Chloroflexota bacterium]